MKPAGPATCPWEARLGSGRKGRERQERAKSAQSLLLRPTPPRWAPPGRTATGRERRALPQARPLSGGSTRPRLPGLGPPPRPRRPLRGFGRGRPPALRRSTLRPHPRGQRTSRIRAGHPRAVAGRWPTSAGGSRLCSEELTPRAVAGPGHSPKYTVLSHLGHLEAMVRTPGRPASSARARLPAAAAASAAPAPPARLSARPLACGRGGASGARPRGPAARDAAGAGAHLPGRTGGYATRLAPLGLARRVASTRPARSSPVSMATSGQPAGPRVGLGLRGPLTGGVLASGASARKGGVGTRRLTPRRRSSPPGPLLASGSPEDPTPPCCAPPPASLCCSVSIATASLWDRSGIRAGAPPGPGPVPAPPNTVTGAGSSAGGGQGLRHFQKQRERNCWKGVREGVPGSEGAWGVCHRL